MAWGRKPFPGESALMFDRLRSDRAHDAWVAVGGWENLRRTVATWHAVTPRHTAPGVSMFTESVADLVGDGLRIGPLADFDDAPLRDLDAEPMAVTARERLAAMLEIMVRDTGNGLAPEKAKTRFDRAAELKRQTEEIARRLESQGFTAFRKTPFDLFMYYVHSGAVERMEQFRRIMFLPSVAALVRAPKVKELEAFLESHPFARMFTFTSGPRTLLYDLRDRISDFHRNLSRLASWMRRTYGVEMVFRSTELGKPETRPDGSPDGAAGEIERDENGTPTFHVHAHTLVWQRRPMRKPEWAAFMRAVWDKWEWFWDDGRSVRDARELCKYVTKPGAVLNLSDTELAELARQLERLKLVAPLGTLREIIRDRKERQMRLEKRKTPDGFVFVEVPDWNRFGPSDNREDAATKRLLKNGVIVPVYGDATASDAVVKLAEVFDSRRRKPDDMPARVVARLVPSFAPGSLVAEPRVCVLSMGWKGAEVAAHPLVLQLRTATAPEWRAGLTLNEHAAVFARASAHACALRVHVSTSTVPAVCAESGTLPGFDPPRTATPLVPAVN